MDDPENGHFAAWDGPPAMQPVRDPATGETSIPQVHVRDVADAMSRVDKDAGQDVLLSTLHQFLLAKTPVNVICQRMNISYGSYKWLREKLTRRIREQAKGRDAFDFIGPMIAEMEEARAVAWREIALSGNHAKNWNRRMRALEVILRSNMDMARLLQVAGLFESTPMRAPLVSDDEDSGSANVLKEMAQRFLEGGYQEPRVGLVPGSKIVGEL
jgi:hypothetical protein